MSTGAGDHAEKKWHERGVEPTLCAGLDRHRHWWPGGLCLAAPGRGHATCCRGFHQADQDAVGTYHLWNGRGRDRQDGKCQRGRKNRHQGADLFRGRLDTGAGDRSCRGEHHPAGRWHEHRCRLDRQQRDWPVCGSCKRRRGHGGFCVEHHSHHVGGCLCQGQHAAGHSGVGAVCSRAVAAGRAWQAAGRSHR